LIRRRVRRKSKTKSKRSEILKNATNYDTDKDSDTDTEPAESELSSEDPTIAKKFTPRAQTQQKMTAYFNKGLSTGQQSPKARGKEVVPSRQTEQEWTSPQPEQHRQHKVSTGSRVWDAERTAREGGGGLARVAKFCDRRNQQLGLAADSTPVVL
jgi:hypothetical protein